MTMQDLAGRRVKLSRCTITAKDGTGKTCGMVRNLERYKDMPLRKQSDHKRTISPIWGNCAGLSLDQLYFDGRTWYYIFWCGYVPPYEMNRYNAKMEILQQLRENGVVVINVESI